MARVLLLLIFVHVPFVIADSQESCNNGEDEGSVTKSVGLLQVERKSDQISMAFAESRTKQLPLKEVFVYNHLPKAGGSFVRGVLENSKVLPPQNMRIVQEHESVLEKDRQRFFTVGSVRNPCEYYVSAWSFGSKIDDGTEKKGYLRFETLPEYRGVSEGFDTPEDKEHFQKWLRYAMPEGAAPGLLTSRMMWSYAPESVMGIPKPEPTMQTSDDRGKFAKADFLKYQNAMSAFNDSNVDCWVRTEDIPSDLRHCLQKFEQRAGKRIVNWKAFEDLLAQREREHEVFNWSTAAGTGRTETYIWTKRTGHAPCHFYFDKDSEEFVRKTDSLVFEKFNYTNCCHEGPSD